MNSKIKKVLLFFFLILLAGGLSQSAKASAVTARLDSVNLLMGKVTTLHLEVVENVGKHGNFTLFNNADRSQKYVTVCGDSVELSTSYKVDTITLGSGKLQLNYEIPLQAFDSGTFRLPEFIYVSGADSLYSNELTFNVIPLSLTADDPIAGFAPVAEPEGKRFYDFIPDWILDFWWIFLIIALAVIAFLWAIKNFKKGGVVKILRKPLPTPYEIAMDGLVKLKAKKLWEQGMEKEYFTDLTDILRNYLEGRFGINAMEMTTRQIMERLYDSDVRDKRDYMRQILNVADFVKFAKVRPLPADNIEAYDNAVKFVEETKPEVVESTDDTEAVKMEEGGGK